MRRVRPEDPKAPFLIRVTPPEALRSPETLGVDGACCVRCPDEPCLRFNSDETGQGNTTRVCPTDAIHRARHEMGPTISDNCIQCGLCAMRCPLGALSISNKGASVSIPSHELTTPALDEKSFFKARESQECQVIWDEQVLATVATRLTGLATTHKQDIFYSLVASLFTSAGYHAWQPARGDTSNRIDLILIHDIDSLPVEVKSCSESPIINVKSVQQALENRVVIDQRDFAPTNRDSSTLVVGFAYPPSRSDVHELVEDIASAFEVRVGLISLTDLYILAIKTLLCGEPPSRRLLSELMGQLS